MRVAVVQLDYHPAFRDALKDPLFDLKRETSTLLPDGAASAPPGLQPKWRALQRRVRDAYLVQLRRRLEALLGECRSWGVDLVVFPEYAIPAALLPYVAEHAGDMVIVGGSHYVDIETIRERVYERLGGARGDELLEQAISPVLHRGRLLGFVPKLHAAKPERPHLVPGKEWAPINMPDGLPGPLGVLICLDYLYRQSPKHQKLVAEPLDTCRLLAAPSLTPAHSIDEFGAKALEDAHRLKRPVLHANHAQGGGSSIHVDDRKQDRRLYPEHAGVLDAGEEGVIVADIDIGFDPAGDSTPYALNRPIIPFAAASLVYRGVDPAYAGWLDKVRAAIDDPARDNVDRLDALVALMREEPPSLPKGASARRRRLERLLQDVEEESSVERVRQLTREVVLPEDVLPQKALRAALARGAADEIQQWVNELDAGDFGPVAGRQRRAWQDIEREATTWTEAARLTANDVSAAARGGPKLPGPKALLQVLAAIEEVVDRRFEKENRQANALFEEGRYEEARAVYSEMLEGAQSILANEAAADRPSLRGWVARWTLNVATATLNLQEIERARELLLTVEPEFLSAKARVLLAEALAQVGQRERARALLPDESGLGVAERERLVEARQTLALLDGELPDPLCKSAPVLARAAWVLLDRGDLAGAAERACDAIEEARADGLATASATLALEKALNDTILEHPPTAKRIPVERREKVIEIAQRHLDALRDRPLPEPIRRVLKAAEQQFRGLIQDRDALPPSDSLSSIAVPGNESVVRDAFALAQEARMEEALELLGTLAPTDHPWLRRYQRLQILYRARAFDRALEEALEVSRGLPGRAWIELLTATLLRDAGRDEEALEHALIALEQLPGVGQRVFVAELRLALGQGQDAWDVLQPIAGLDRPSLHRTLARAAWQSGRPAQALEVQRRYVERRPEDIRGRLELAWYLSARRVPREAADIAWRVFEEQGDRLAPRFLHLCGSLQRPGGPPEEERRRRVKAIAARLRERFPTSPEAEQLRWNLLTSLGALPEGETPNFELLASEGRAYIGTSLDELRSLIERHHAWADIVYKLGRLGAMPTAASCALTNTPVALAVTRILRASRHAKGLFCPPVSLTDAAPLVSLDGVELLVSHLELLLLEALGLIERLHTALGETGRMVIFAHVRDRIREEELQLTIQVQREQLDRQDTWLREVERIRRAPVDQGAWSDDAAVARRIGAALIAQEAPADLVRISPLALLRRLHEERLIDVEKHEAIFRFLSAEPSPPEPLPEPMPERMLLTSVLLEPLLRAGALEALLDLLGGRVLLAPMAAEQLRRQRDALVDDIKAAQHADAVQALVVEGLDAGWIVLLPDRARPPLPPPRDPSNTWIREMVVAPLAEAVAYAEEVAERPERWRLAADFFGSHSLGAPELIWELDWQSHEQIQELAHRLLSAAERRITMPALVRLLIRESREADRYLGRLADMGFPDALGPGELLRLERSFQGIDKGEPARLLDHQEWMAQEPGHRGGELARQRLAAVYAEAALRAFCDEGEASGAERTQAEKESLVGALLGRVERIGRATATNMLDLTLGFMALMSVERWRSEWLFEGDKAARNERGPVTALWKALAAWAGEDGSRRASYGRALRQGWSALNVEHAGPTMLHAATLLLALPARAPGSGLVSFLDPAMEALAILSASWEERPLVDRGIQVTVRSEEAPLRIHDEEILMHGAALLAAEPASAGNARIYQYLFPLPDHAGALRVEAPIEALFLRAPVSARAGIALRLLELQGPYDGVLCTQLQGITKAPDDGTALRKYANLAATALFRLVQDDPTYLRIWGHSRRIGANTGLPGLEGIRELLSEPVEGLPAGSSIGAELKARVESGAWSRRKDAGYLLWMASQVPGTLPAVAVWGRLHEEQYEMHVAVALHRLDHADVYAAACIAGDVMFLRVAAALRPKVKLPDGEVDLHELLPGRLARLLERVAALPPPDTMAAAEAALLRLCADIVQRVAGDHLLELREGLWLTYRLFQWLCLQLEELSPDARREGLGRLASLAPEPREPRDRLDPFGFAPDRFDHRLAAVVAALGFMEELVRVFRKQVPAAELPAPRSISSPALEDRLLEIAARPIVGSDLRSVLDWDAPGNTPDIALLALLRLNGGAFARLGVEARMRHMEALPVDPEDLEGPAKMLAFFVVVAAADNARELTDDERALLESRARAMVLNQTGRLWRCMIFVSLFAAGAVHLQEEARSSVLQELAQPLASLSVGRFLMGLAAHDASGLAAMVESVLAQAPQQDADPVDLILGGLGRVAVHGAPAAQEAAFAVLRGLANRPPFSEDPRMHEVVRFFGLQEGQA